MLRHVWSFLLDLILFGWLGFRKICWKERVFGVLKYLKIVLKIGKRFWNWGILRKDSWDLRLEMVNTFIFGWIGGTLLEFCLRNLITGLFMIPKVVWKLNFHLLSIMVIGFGNQLDQRHWLRFKLDYLKLVWDLVINLFGMLLGKEFMFAQKCHHQLETQAHLFFECSFSYKIWRFCMMRCRVENIFVVWDDIV